MAVTLTPDNDLLFYSFPIEKQEETADGDVLVWGKATDGSLDADLQIVDPAFSAKALREWFDTGANVRVQHQAQRDPAGRGVDIETGADGATWVKTLVVEPIAKELVRKGVLKDYSVGICHPDIRIADPRFSHLDPEHKAVNGVITGRKDGISKIGELSLCDRGSNFGTRFQLAKAAADGGVEFVGKMLEPDAPLAKSAEPDVPLEATVHFSPTSLAKLLEHRRIAEDREAQKAAAGADEAGGDNAEADQEDEADDPDMEPDDSTDTSKGTDPDVIKAETAVYKRDVSTAERKKLAEQGHALADGSYPIATTEDLKNAATLARSGHGNAAAAKKLIARRASELGVSNPLDSDSADKAVTPEGLDLTGEADATAVVARAMDEVLAKAMKPKMPCGGCGKKVKASAAFCPGCGKKMTADKSASPADGVTDAEPTQSVPAHREPDGMAMETFEDDAHLEGTNPDEGSERTAEAAVAPPAAEAAELGKSVAPGAQEVISKAGAQWAEGILHDLLCPAFSPDDTAKSYPGYALADVTAVEDWQAKALDASVSAPLAEAEQAQQRWMAAFTLKGTKAEDIESLRWEAHKAFSDANPGPSTYPAPGELRPQMFRRPILTDGQSANPPASGTSPTTITAEHVAAADFRRGPLTGDQSPPTAAEGDNGSQPGPTVTGRPQRTFYRNTARDGARSAMSSMHDHIAHTFPDLCPMHGPGTGGQPATGARPVPVPGTRKEAEGDTEKAADAMPPGKIPCPGCKKKVKQGKPFCSGCGHKMGAAKDADADVSKAAGIAIPGTLEPTSGPDIAELVKSAVADATGPLVRQLKEQGELIDQMAAAPDPRYAPFKAVASGGILPKSAGSGVEPPQSPIEKASHLVQNSMLSDLQHQARNDPDPAKRELAWTMITSLLKLPSAAAAPQ